VCELHTCCWCKIGCGTQRAAWRRPTSHSRLDHEITGVALHICHSLLPLSFLACERQHGCSGARALSIASRRSHCSRKHAGQRSHSSVVICGVLNPPWRVGVTRPLTAQLVGCRGQCCGHNRECVMLIAPSMPVAIGLLTTRRVETEFTHISVYACAAAVPVHVMHSTQDVFVTSCC